MSSIERYQRPEVGRPGWRTLARLETTTAVRLTHLDHAAEIQAATVAAVSYVGRRAMQDVALLSQVEQQLATAVPLASGRLAAIADLTAVALSEVVADTATKLRRV
jgi:hypothetical protein